MSLENEYFHWKKMVENEKRNLEKFESLDVTQMDEMQLEARHRGIESCKEGIEEFSEIFEEIKEELKEFIKEGGEVSQKTLDEFKEEDEKSSSSETIENEVKNMVTEENWVSFKIVSKNDDRIYLAGQFDVNSYDEDTDLGDWEYEQNDGTMASHIPSYWKVNGENISFDYDQFIDSIEWDLLQQYLFDFAEENKSIGCEDYILHINEGATVEMEIIKYSDFEDTYWATLMFRYNGEFIVFDEKIIRDLAESLSFDGEYRITSASSIDLQLPRGFSDYADEYDINESVEVVSEMTQTVREHFARQLSRNEGIYAQYGENIEQLVEEDIASDMEQMFSFVSSDNIKDWLIENAYLEE